MSWSDIQIIAALRCDKTVSLILPDCEHLDIVPFFSFLFSCFFFFSGGNTSVGDLLFFRVHETAVQKTRVTLEKKKKNWSSESLERVCHLLVCVQGNHICSFSQQYALVARNSLLSLKPVSFFFFFAFHTLASSYTKKKKRRAEKTVCCVVFGLRKVKRVFRQKKKKSGKYTSRNDLCVFSACLFLVNTWSTKRIFTRRSTQRDRSTTKRTRTLKSANNISYKEQLKQEKKKKEERR